MSGAPHTTCRSRRARRVTTLPIWAVYIVILATPLLAFLGVIVGNVVLRKGANELDVWRRREETMRMLRWASEQAASASPTKARMGVAARRGYSRRCAPRAAGRLR